MRKLIAVLLALCLVSCQSVNNRKREELYAIAEGDSALSESFALDGRLYLLYLYEGKDFFLSAALPKEGKELKKKNRVLESYAVKDKNLPGAENREKIYMVPGVLDRALEREVMNIAPREKGTGFILSSGFKDMVFYRDSDGKLHLTEPARLSKNIKLVRARDRGALRAAAVKNALQILAAEYPGKTKFLFPVKQIPQVPYIYFDAEKQFMSAVRLPDLYEVKKDISSAGIVTDFIYSVIIGSHLFAVVKAPITSTHSLASTLYSRLAVIFSPKVNGVRHNAPPLNTSGEMMDLDAFNAFLDKHTRKGVYKGYALPLIDGEEFFPHFVRSVQNAVKYIDVRVYIYKTDPYSLSLSDLLKKKSNEGVDVRVLTDDMNTVLNWIKTPRVLPSPDYKMPSLKKYLKEGSKIKVRTHPNTWGNVDHTKVMVIDGETAYAGGMNFGEEYRYDWHDLMIALRGPIVNKLRNDFEEAWAFSGAGGEFLSAAVMANRDCDECFKEDYAPGMIDIRPLYTKPSRPDIFTAQYEAIKRAKSRIYIQNAYFSDNKIARALIDARQRGVDVRVILPAENDIGMMTANNMVKTNALLANGIRVYFYPEMSHVKAAIYDNWACVGSANFDRMSLHVNGEMSLGISDPAFVEELNERLFRKDFEDSDEITEPLKLDTKDYLLTMLSSQG